MQCYNTHIVCRTSNDDASFIEFTEAAVEANCDFNKPYALPARWYCTTSDEPLFVATTSAWPSEFYNQATISADFDDTTIDLFEGWYTGSMVVGALLLFISFFWLGQWIYRK